MGQKYQELKQKAVSVLPAHTGIVFFLDAITMVSAWTGSRDCMLCACVGEQLERRCMHNETIQ